MEEGLRRRLLDDGRAAFNRGEFYEAHEFWEEVWDVADEPERLWLQAMIQIATGLHKLVRFRSDVCATLLGKALAKLDGAPEVWAGFALGRLAREAQRVLAAIGRGERPDPSSVRLDLDDQRGAE